ncbi:MAG: hypothetical protein ACXVB5_21735, partial [Isosphaeraceae bacterium]
MNSVGEQRIEQHLLLARVLMREGRTIEEALSAAGALIPSTDHDAVRRAHEEQRSTTITVLEPGVLADGGPRAWFENYN